jgi:hypothetical protein
MHRRLLSFLVLFLLPAAALAQMGSNPGGGMMPGVPLGQTRVIDTIAKKRILLSNYCRLDFEGARLQPDGWRRFKPYTSIPSNPDFSRIVIVSRYTVPVIEQDSAVFFVNYQTVGYYDELAGYSPSAINERAEFQVADHHDEPTVTEVSPGMPHVSPRAAVAWMNLRLADPKTGDVERAHLKSAIEQLNKLLPPPMPAAKPQGS